MTQSVAGQRSIGKAPLDLGAARFFKRSLVRNVAILGGGTALAQGFNILLAPVLTRLYLPNHFGQYAIFVSFLNVAMVGASLRYELAIVSASSEQKAAQLTFAAFLFSLPTSLMAAGMLLLLMHFSLLGFGALPFYAPVLMTAAVILVGSFSVLRYWFVRQEQFGYVSHATIVQNGVRSVSQVAIGAVGGQLGGLLAGELLGRSFGMSSMFRSAWPRISTHVIPIKFNRFTSVLRENWRFPIYSLPSSLVDSAAANLCVPLVVWCYGSNAGGYFALVQRVLAIPFVLIATSVADVFQARLALYTRNSPDRISRLFRNTAVGLFSIGVLPAILLMLYGESLFHFFFGGKWMLAGRLAAILAPWFLAQFVATPLSRLVFVLEGQRLKLIYDVLALTGMIGVFVFSRWRQLSLVRSVMLLNVVGTVTYVVYYLLLLRIVSQHRCAAVAEDDAQPCIQAG